MDDKYSISDITHITFKPDLNGVYVSDQDGCVFELPDVFADHPAIEEIQYIHDEFVSMASWYEIYVDEKERNQFYQHIDGEFPRDKFNSGGTDLCCRLAFLLRDYHFSISYRDVLLKSKAQLLFSPYYYQHHAIYQNRRSLELHCQHSHHRQVLFLGCNMGLMYYSLNTYIQKANAAERESLRHIKKSHPKAELIASLKALACPTCKTLTSEVFCLVVDDNELLYQSKIPCSKCKTLLQPAQQTPEHYFCKRCHEKGLIPVWDMIRHD